MNNEPPEPYLYVRLDGKKVEGPFPSDAVRIMVRRKELSMFTPVRPEGTDLWIPFEELPRMNLPKPAEGMWPIVVVILVAAAILFLLAKRWA